MQYHAIPCNIMQYHAIPCNTMQYHAISCNTMQYPAIPCNTMQYYAIQCNTMQYHAKPCIINNCWRSVPLPCGQYNGHFLPLLDWLHLNPILAVSLTVVMHFQELSGEPMLACFSMVGQKKKNFDDMCLLHLFATWYCTGILVRVWRYLFQAVVAFRWKFCNVQVDHNSQWEWISMW